MPFGEMSITLHDVHHILGIPIDGEALSRGRGVNVGKSVIDYECGNEDPEVKSKVAVLLGKTEEDLSNIYKGGGVFVSELLKVVEQGDDRDASKAYLILVLGQTLFLDKSGDKVRARLLLLCDDLERVHEYAWGTAALAYLFRQLGMASRAGARGMSGCVSLLQAWIYEYFPCFRPQDGLYVEGEPRVKAWTHLPRFSRSQETMARYRQRLDALEAYDVCWLPYGPSPQDKCPLTLYYGLIRYLDVVEPYAPDRILRQFGYPQTRPQGMRMPADFGRPADPRGHYFNDYGEFVDLQWMGRRDNGITFGNRSRRVKMPFDAHPDYMDWYRRISHPHVLPPAHRLRIERRGQMHEQPEVALVMSRGLARAYAQPTKEQRHLYLDRFLRDMEEYFVGDVEDAETP
jgi:hypothetical protein